MLLRLPTNYTPSTVMATRRDGSKKTDLLPSVASHPLTQSVRSSMSTFASKWGSNRKKEKKKKRERKGKVEEEGKKERKRKRKGKEQEQFYARETKEIERMEKQSRGLAWNRFYHSTVTRLFIPMQPVTKKSILRR